MGYLTCNRYIIQPEYNFSIRYIELLGLGVLYTVLRNFSFKNYIWLLLAIVVSGTIQAVYGNLQLLGYYASNHSLFRMTGSYFNPGPYAGFLTAVWSVALGLYLFKDKMLKQLLPTNKSNYTHNLIAVLFEYIPLLGVISILLVLPTTQSRSAWLAVLLSSTVLIEYRYHILKGVFKNINRLKKSVLIIVSLSIIGAGLFGVYNFKKESSNGRLFIWEVSTKIIKENPFFGVGHDRFKANYMNAQAHFFKENGETKDALVADNTYYAFNEWLQYIVENGLIGGVFLALFLYILFKVTVDEPQKFIVIILFSGLLAISVFAFFSYPMQILPVKMILIVLIGFLSKLDRKKYIILSIQNRSRPYVFGFSKTAIFILSTIGIVKGVTYTNTLGESFTMWQNALSTYQYGDYEGAIQEYEQVYSILKKEGDFLMNYGKTLSINKQNKQAVKILEEAKIHLNTTIIETALGDAYKGLKQYNKAEEAYQNATNMIPIRFFPMYLLAKMYDESGNRIEAIAMAQKILNKDIKVPSTAIKEMKAEMKILVKSDNNNCHKN
ncbi:O-antigen ligase family protein [Formosa sp. 3Alg 14/1]|uniref:O-antigen ligase family protein n=1 Tax=Formosa sp. 3Alg 14/1 TaxID=3382190 RepID=UPI0039BEA235